MSNRQKPRINPGYFEGRRRGPLTVPPDLSSHEKGEYRKSYWQGRVHSQIDDFTGCVAYLRSSQLETLAGKLKALYAETLIMIHGEEGAKEFLAKIEGLEDRLRQERADRTASEKAGTDAR